MGIIKDTPIVAFDCETTGLNPAKERIVELAAVKTIPGRNPVEFQHLVNPGRIMSDEVVRIHGITNAQVEGKAGIAPALKEFVEFIGDAVLVGHNSAFDVSFIAAELQRNGMSQPSNLVLDTHRMARGTLGKFMNYKLGHLAVQLDFPKRLAHRALADSYTCLDLFNHCVGIMGGPEKTAAAAGVGTPPGLRSLDEFAAHPSFDCQGLNFFLNRDLLIKLNAKREHIKLMREALGSATPQLEFSLKSRFIEAAPDKKILTLSGVCVWQNKFVGPPDVLLMTTTLKGEDFIVDMRAIIDVARPSAQQMSMFS